MTGWWSRRGPMPTLPDWHSAQAGACLYAGTRRLSAQAAFCGPMRSTCLHRGPAGPAILAETSDMLRGHCQREVLCRCRGTLWQGFLYPPFRPDNRGWLHTRRQAEHQAYQVFPSVLPASPGSRRENCCSPATAIPALYQGELRHIRRSCARCGQPLSHLNCPSACC